MFLIEDRCKYEERKDRGSKKILLKGKIMPRVILFHTHRYTHSHTWIYKCVCHFIQHIDIIIQHIEIIIQHIDHYTTHRDHYTTYRDHYTTHRGLYKTQRSLYNTKRSLYNT